MYWTKMNMKKFDNLSININNNQKKKLFKCKQHHRALHTLFSFYTVPASVFVFVCIISQVFWHFLGYLFIKMMKHMMSKRLIALSANDKKKSHSDSRILFSVVFSFVSLLIICVQFVVAIVIESVFLLLLWIATETAFCSLPSYR